MLQQDKLAFPFNMLNGQGKSINKMGLKFPQLQPEAVLNQASKQAGLTDFGPDGFMKGLDALMYSAKTDNINFLGKM